MQILDWKGRGGGRTRDVARENCNMLHIKPLNPTKIGSVYHGGAPPVGSRQTRLLAKMHALKTGRGLMSKVIVRGVANSP